ncbi:MAG: hydroxyacylglutathione hydrolase [Burkholderiales bacterium]|nr:hydroxyacylglutathione hydrolase [Burkholderiales bacterium]
MTSTTVTSSPAASSALEIVAIPAFDDNYIWALIRGTQCAVVDPGDAAPVMAFLQTRGLSLCAILLTHHHGDHTGGVAALTAAWHVPVYGPADDAMPHVTQTVHDNTSLPLPALGISTIHVLAVPGHTATHIAWWLADAGQGAGSVFCGDTLFAAGCGRLLGGTAAQLHASLQRLAALPGNTAVYCAHEYTLSNLRFALAVEPGNAALVAREFDAQATRARGEATVPSTISLERDSNPFLRCDQAEVIASARRHAQAVGNPLPTASCGLDVFTTLREWKNSFR